MKKKPSDEYLAIRLPRSEKRAYERAAAKRALKVTAWVRLHLRKAAGLDR